MRQIILGAIAVFILAVFMSYSSKQSTTAVNGLEKNSNTIKATQTDLIYEYSNLFPNNTQLSIAFIENGSVQFYGIKRTNDSIKTIENHQSVFEIGSVSKVFTATLLAGFATNNQLNLNDSIAAYLDYELAADASISFENLANHTSGLPRLPSNLSILSIDPHNPYKNYDEKKLVEYLTQKMNLEQLPGEKYAYSNLGAGLLGFILSKKFDATYGALLDNHIFSKYNMNNSTTTRPSIEHKLVKGLDTSGEPTSNWDLSALQGCGGILSSTEDLSKFALAHFDDDNKTLALTRQPTFTINENMDMALGWHILNKQTSSKWYWHNGGTGGYTASITIDTSNKNGVIILSNVSAFHKKMGNIDELCFALMNTLKK